MRAVEFNYTEMGANVFFKCFYYFVALLSQLLWLSPYLVILSSVNVFIMNYQESYKELVLGLCNRENISGYWSNIFNILLTLSSISYTQTPPAGYLNTLHLHLFLYKESHHCAAESCSLECETWTLSTQENALQCLMAAGWEAPSL